MERPVHQLKHGGFHAPKLLKVRQVSDAVDGAATENLFAGSGEMGALMRSLDWSQTPLGSVENWSQSLKTAIRIILGSRYPMCVWWGHQMINLYNDAYTPILGQRHPAALGQSAFDVWADVWDVVGPQVEAVLNEGRPSWHKESLFILERNGYREETYFTFSQSPVPADDGGPGGVFCAITEETERVLSDRRLRTLRELGAETVTAKTVEAACEISATVLTRNGYDIPFALFYLLDSEARLVNTTRLAVGTIASPEVIKLSSVETSDEWQLAQVIETGQSKIVDDLEARFGRLPGGAWSDSPQQAVVLPLARSGEMFGFLIAGVSPLRAFDDDYKGFFDLMAGQVTTAISNAHTYEEERKRAEALAELDRAKTTFLSNVSHEFRTPLTLMLSPLEDTMANLHGTIPPQESEQLRLVQRNGMRLLKLVNSLLDFSRIEASRIEASYEPVDLATYTAELASTFRSLIERAGMSLIVECPPLREAVYVDREMWEKIVLNLLSNAFKFTLAGTITVRLRWIDFHVELSVADTGVGIPSEELPYLFERFHRVKNSQGRSFEGSGIGLSLVQELVKLHGGAIEVFSTFGHGSCFTVKIPSGTAHLPKERIGASPTLASTALGAMPYVEEAQRWLPHNGDIEGLAVDLSVQSFASESHIVQSEPLEKQAHILLADDNADMRDYILRLLSGYYTVQTVADGVTALTAIQNNPPDLVLTDVMMPGMDGFELLRSLRCHPTTQDIPIILLSARAGEESRIEGLLAGADDYLIKPFSARELLARVEASLKLARLRQEATQREETILNRVSDAFMAMDLDFRFTYANQAAQRVSRTPLEALLGKTMWESFPATVGTQFEFQYRRSLTEQVAVEFEEYYAPLDLWVEVHVYPSPTGLSLFFRDINDRKQAEQEIRKFVFLADNSTEFIGMCDLNFLPFYLNKAGRQMVGLDDAQQYSKTPLREFFFPEDRDFIVNEFFPRVLHSGRAEVEIRFRHFKTGEAVWVIYNVFYIRGENDEPIGIAIVSRNITDRKQAEEVLVERSRLSALSADIGSILIQDDTLPDTLQQCTEALVRHLDAAFARIWTLNRDKNVLELQASAGIYTHLDGFHSQVPVGQFKIGLIAQERQPHLTNNVIGDPRVHNQEWAAREGMVAFAGYPLIVENQVVGVMALFSRHWLSEIALQAMASVADALSLGIQRKQVTIEREQLLEQEQAARFAAEAANRIKDEFLAVLSHELRSPLNPILGWSKLLQQRKMDAEKTTTALATIERNAQLQLQLIDDLLDISRILRGKLSLNAMPVDLSAVISAALEIVRLAAETKSLQIQTTFSPNVVMVIGDAGRLQQVVWNLLSNAVKFTPQGGQITVKLTPTATHAQIQVTDTGKGIRPDFLPYVFEHFRQEDGATTRKFGGLGLGLAIARQIVELHGGTVAVDSQGEGQGATFTVQIPLASGSSQLPTVEQSSDSIGDLSGIHILVVDDDADSREFVAFVLEQAGATVTTVASGIDALQAFSQAVPNLIVSDIGMPEMDGYMLMRQIRRLPLEQGGQIPAVALTAYAGELDQQQAIAAGFQRHIAKPIDPEVVVAIVIELVSSVLTVGRCQ